MVTIKSKVEESDLENDNKERLHQMCFKYIQAFALDQKHCAMSHLIPIKVKLEENSLATNQKSRMMSFDYLQCQEEKLKDLLTNDLLFPNSAPFTAV